MDELELENNEEVLETLQEATDNTNEQFDGASQDDVYQEEAKSLWEQDKRFGKLWNKPDDMYGHVQHLEKKYQPLETVLSQRGIKDHDGLTNILSEYDKYVDPNSEINQTFLAIQNLLEHPEYGNKFQEFVNQVVEQEEMQRYGTRLPQEVKQQLQEVENLKQWKQQQEHEREVARYEQEIDNSISKIEAFCKEKGIEIAEDDIKNHLLYCAENKIGVDYVFDKFVTNSLDKILGNVQNKTSKAVVNNIKNNSKSAIATGSRIAPSISSVPSNPQELRQALQQQLGD